MRLDLIEVRHSDGTFIRPFVPMRMGEPMSVSLEREIGRALEFLHVRRVPRGRSVAEVARRAKPADLRKLGSCLRRMTRISKAGRLLGEPYLGSHIAMANVAHNTIMARIMNMLRAMFQAVHRVRFVSRDPHARSSSWPGANESSRRSVAAILAGG